MKKEKGEERKGEKCQVHDMDLIPTTNLVTEAGPDPSLGVLWFWNRQDGVSNT